VLDNVQLSEDVKAMVNMFDDFTWSTYSSRHSLFVGHALWSVVRSWMSRCRAAANQATQTRPCQRCAHCRWIVSRVWSLNVRFRHICRDRLARTATSLSWNSRSLDWQSRIEAGHTSSKRLFPSIDPLLVVVVNRQVMPSLSVDDFRRYFNDKVDGVRVYVNLLDRVRSSYLCHTTWL